MGFHYSCMIYLDDLTHNDEKMVKSKLSLRIFKLQMKCAQMVHHQQHHADWSASTYDEVSTSDHSDPKLICACRVGLTQK